MNTLGTLVVLSFIDKFGRRWILLKIIPFICISHLLIALGLGLKGFGDEEVAGSGKWISLIGILCYLAFYSISLGCTPWTVNSEIFPLHLRGVGNSLATTSNWVSNFIISQFFLLATDTILGQVITFISIAGMMILAWLFVYKLLPETRGKPID